MSGWDAEGVARLAGMVKESSREAMLECMEEKDYKGFQYAKNYFERADRYLDDYFTSEFNKLDACQIIDDSSNSN
nr:hypothetical protein HmN_000243800 [Hymenolepis microstoma]